MPTTYTDVYFFLCEEYLDMKLPRDCSWVQDERDALFDKHLLF
jgi:hypothetical protein